MTVIDKVLGRPERVDYDKGKVWLGEVDRGKWELEVSGDDLTVRCISMYGTVIQEEHLALAFRQEVLMENMSRRRQFLEKEPERRGFSAQLVKGMTRGLYATDKFGREYTASLNYLIDGKELQQFEPNRDGHVKINHNDAFDLELKCKHAVFQPVRRQPLELPQIMNPLCSRCETVVWLPETRNAVQKYLDDVTAFFEGSDVEFKSVKLEEKVNCQLCGNEITANLHLTPTVPIVRPKEGLVEILKRLKSWEARPR